MVCCLWANKSPSGLSSAHLITMFLLLGSSMLDARAEQLTRSDTQQLAPSGYTGAINTPIADVLPLGSSTIAYTNNIPERARKYPGVGTFGGVDAGFGVLPGLELVARLTFDGDPDCNLFLGATKCKATTRDLSASGKYELPFVLPLNTRAALGFTDLGGAATHYRSVYGVTTSSIGPVDLSVGYSKQASSSTVASGLFGSASLRLTENLKSLAEHNPQGNRIGVQYNVGLTNDMLLQLGFSKLFSSNSALQSTQGDAALRFYFDKPDRLASYHHDDQFVTAKLKRKSIGKEKAAAVALPAQEFADRLSKKLADDGFSSISIARLPASGNQPELWWLQIEPSGWRKNQLTALGVALADWLPGNGPEDAQVVISLTYLGERTITFYADNVCLDQFVQSRDNCYKGVSPHFYQGIDLPQRLTSTSAGEFSTLVSRAVPNRWKPNFELGINLRTAVGTEVGVVDYAAALDVGMDMQLSRGLTYQGSLLVPVSHSDSFDPGQPFSNGTENKTLFNQSMVTYWRPFTNVRSGNLAGQISLGALDYDHRGGQADALWRSQDGELRFGVTAGAYRYLPSGQNFTPLLASMTYTVLPGLWQLGASAGKFLNGDVGAKVSSSHWFGDYRLNFYVSDSKLNQSGAIARKFAGFDISLPFGANTYESNRYATVRGRDRWNWGLQSQIGTGGSNPIVLGYGIVPQPRHGLWSDVTDYDRNGVADLYANGDYLLDKALNH